MFWAIVREVKQKLNNRSIAWRECVERWEALRLRSTHPLPETTIADLLGRAGPAVLPPVMDDICLPPYASAEPSKHDDYATLMSIAVALNPTVVIELGTAHGNTVANLCLNCRAATVYTVNAPAAEMTGAATTFALTPSDIGRVYRSLGLEHRVVQIFANTMNLDLLQHLRGLLAQLAIIDACHDTAFVLNDFKKVLPHVAPGGIVLLHDTHPSMRGHLIGSYAACTILRREGYDVTHIRGTWWGVWMKPA